MRISPDKKSGTNPSTLPRSWQPEKEKFANLKAIHIYQLKGGPPTEVWEEGHKILDLHGNSGGGPDFS